MSKSKNQKFDLIERTAEFGENIIILCKQIKSNPINDSLIRQLIRAATSIGANYCEADCAETKKDFEHKIAICKKEAKESRHWLRMLIKANPEFKLEISKFWKEANELNLIFSKIIINSKSKI